MRARGSGSKVCWRCVLRRVYSAGFQRRQKGGLREKVAGSYSLVGELGEL